MLCVLAVSLPTPSLLSEDEEDSHKANVWVTMQQTAAEVETLIHKNWCYPWSVVEGLPRFLTVVIKCHKKSFVGVN